MRKYRLYMYALFFGIGVFFYLQCESTYLPVDSGKKIDYLQGNTVARVVLKVLDYHSSAPLSGAMVKILGLDSAKTDSAGTVTFDSVKTGAYLITCTKKGFAGITDQVSLSIDSNSNTVPVVSQSTDLLFMAKSGVAVKGNLYFENENKISPANGATIECRLTNPTITFLDPIVVATSENGTYTFRNLPEYCTYTLTVLPLSDESLTYKQAAATTVAGTAAGDSLRAANIILQKFTDGTFIILNHNLETFTRDDSLKFEFSETVDIDLLSADSIYIMMNPGTRILTKQIWQKSGKNLVIFPFNGTWDPGKTYTLVIRKIRSVSDKPLDNTGFNAYTFSPQTSGSLGNVNDLHYRVGAFDTTKVDYNTSTLNLLWSVLENATQYQIYQKSSIDSSWSFLVGVTDTITSITTSQQFTLGKVMRYIVLGKNSSNLSSFESATVLTVKDNKKPFFSYSRSQSGFNNSTSSYTDTISITITSGYIPEPMDTSKSPTVTVKEAGYTSGSGLTVYGDTLNTIDPNKCFWTWTTDQSGVINFVVDPLENGSYDSLKIDFSSVTDWAGNTPDTTQGGNYIRVYTLP
ncbi:MAG: carboxypeptidase regulatory-like domain-containing protein [Chitinispirillaceae bacterium]|nr:carboxypeptidase regulatory-like domain-containing protein [Chitinispirillaceae bacterium]